MKDEEVPQKEIIPGVVMYFKNGNVADLVPYKKGFILLDSSTGDLIPFDIEKIEGIGIGKGTDIKEFYSEDNK